MAIKKQALGFASIFYNTCYQVVMILLLGLFTVHQTFADSSQPRAAYYRYYDQKGIATVSKSVSPTHIKRGYEILDQSMYVISKVPPYSVEKDLKQENNRAIQSEQQKKDIQLQRAYRNVKHATQKKNESLTVIQKQMNQQYEQLRRLQTDRSDFLKQKAQYISQKKAIPTALQQNISNNELHLKNTRTIIEQLKVVQAQQITKFDYIISRLQKME